MKTLELRLGDDGVALIHIDLVDRPMNVLTPELVEDLAAAVEEVVAAPGITGVILASAKPGAFVAGADIKGMLALLDAGPVPAAQGAALGEAFGRLTRRMEACGKPFVAALEGPALGGGFELALACHRRVMADQPKAVVGLPEVGLGLLPAGGGTQRLPRLIGIEKALGLLLTGRHVKAAEALKLGLVHELVPAGDTVAAARRWLLTQPRAVQPWDDKGFRIPGGAGPTAPHASRSFTAGTTLLAGQTQRNLPAPLAILSCVYEGTQLPLDVGLRVERKYFGRLLADPVARNLMRTLFLNKGRIDKLANRPVGVPPSKVARLGVLGAGMMGAGIAHVAAGVGIEVVLLDSTLAQAERGKAHAARQLDKAVERGRTTREQADAVLARIRPATDHASLAGCDFVIEAVFENRDIKAQVTRQACAAMAATAVFGSNTSTLPITGLAQAFERPEDFIGVHFFSPVERMPLIELIVGEQTSPRTLARAMDLAAQLRKTPIVVNDRRGFFTSRVFGTFIKEGIAMLQEGVAPALIENAARQAGMPVGPLAVIDEVSLDITLKVYEQWRADGVQPPHEPVLSIDATRKMVDQLGRRGKAAGAGFYEYPEGGRKFLWPGLSEHWPVAAQQPSVDHLGRRFLTIQALEGARCMEEEVVRDPADADVGSILGIGYPAWTGGVLSYIETVGLARFVADAQEMARLHGPRYQPSPWLVERALRNAPFYPPMG